jgi:hypothetical protein
MVKIIRISDKAVTNLFKAPQYPGRHYNITVELWHDDKLLEKE